MVRQSKILQTSTGLHYTPVHSGAAISGNKRTLIPSNSTSTNKEPKSSPATIGKSCTTCLRHNREGAAISETIMKKHAAATCRVNPANYPPAATDHLPLHPHLTASYP